MADEKPRILLVTQNHLFRECLASALEGSGSGLQVDIADRYSTARDMCTAETYDLAIFDGDPPNQFTPAAARDFTQAFPQLRLVVVGRCRDETEVIGYLEAGATDFRITDTESLEDFCSAIHAALGGVTMHCPERTRALFSRLQELSAEVSRIKAIDTTVLTDREMEILRLLDEGRSNKEIAKELHISLHTVKNHVHRILEKLEVSNRREAVHLAYNNGWLKVQTN